MSNNLPARIPVRAEKEITKANAPSAPAIVSAEIRVPMPPASPAPMSASSGLNLERRALALALRFASRLASRAPIPALTGCHFVDGFLLATDLDVALRVQLPGSHYLDVLVPVDPLKRCLAGSTTPDVEIATEAGWRGWHRRGRVPGSVACRVGPGGRRRAHRRHRPDRRRDPGCRHSRAGRLERRDGPGASVGRLIATELKANGVKFTPEPTTVRIGTRVRFIEGPQGVPIELLDRTV